MYPSKHQNESNGLPYLLHGHHGEDGPRRSVVLPQVPLELCGDVVLQRGGGDVPLLPQGDL